MSKKLWQRASVCLCLAISAVAIAACGSSSNSGGSSGASSTSAAATTTSAATTSSGATSTSGGGGTSTSGGSSSGGSKADAAAAAAQKTPTSIEINVPLKKKPPTGKTIDFLQCSQPVCQGYLDGLTPAAKALGWTVKTIPFQPTPEAEIQAVEQAVTNKADGIYVTGLPRSVIQSGLAKAQAAHIPVVDGYDTNPVAPPIIANIANGPGNNFAPNAVASYIASDSKCQGAVEVYDIKTYPILVYTTNILEKKLKQLCPSGLTVSEDDVQATDVGSKIPADVTGDLQRNPKIKYTAFAFGDMALGVPAAMKAAGVSAQVIGYGAGGPTNVEAVAKGDEDAETAYGIPYGSWRAMDAFARDFEGMSAKIDTTAVNPGELFTKTNAGSVSGWTNMAMSKTNDQQWEKLWHTGG
jgi:ribose transport system substrate-binding protein